MTTVRKNPIQVVYGGLVLIPPSSSVTKEPGGNLTVKLDNKVWNIEDNQLPSQSRGITVSVKKKSRNSEELLVENDGFYKFNNNIRGLFEADENIETSGQDWQYRYSLKRIDTNRVQITLLYFRLGKRFGNGEKRVFLVHTGTDTKELKHIFRRNIYLVRRGDRWINDNRLKAKENIKLKLNTASYIYIRKNKEVPVELVFPVGAGDVPYLTFKCDLSVTHPPLYVCKKTKKLPRDDPNPDFFQAHFSFLSIFPKEAEGRLMAKRLRKEPRENYFIENIGQYKLTTNDEEGYFRFVEGDFHAAFNKNSKFSDGYDSSLIPLKKLENRFLAKCEIQHIKLKDRSNSGLRTYSEKMAFSLRKKRGGEAYFLFFYGEASIDRSKLNRLMEGRLKSELPTEGYNKYINYGDVALELAKSDKIYIRSMNCPTLTGISLKNGWSIPISRLIKSPFHREGMPQERIVAGKNGNGLFDPRTEIFNASPDNIIVFNADGKPILDGKNSNLLEGFSPDTTNEIGLLKPGNSYLRHDAEGAFIAGTTIVRDHGGSTKYLNVNATIFFPEVASETALGLLQEAPPTFKWVDDFSSQDGSAGLENSEVRRAWWPAKNITSNEFKTLLRNNSEDKTLLPHGWKVAYDLKGTSCFPFIELRFNPDGTETAAVKTEKNKDIIPNDAVWEGACGRKPVEIQIPGTHFERLFGGQKDDPSKIYWAGLLVLKGNLEPPDNLPSDMIMILNELEVGIAWWDGSGAFASSHYDGGGNVLAVNFETEAVEELPEADVLEANSNFNLYLEEADILVYRSKIERLFLHFRWRLPFFLRRDGKQSHWVDIHGRWETNDNGKKVIVFSASVSGAEIDLNWLIFKKLKLHHISLVNKEGSWRISVDGEFIFDDTKTSVFAKWFDPPLEALTFNEMDFPLNWKNVSQDFSFPTLSLPNPYWGHADDFEFGIVGFMLSVQNEKPAVHFLGELKLSEQFSGFWGRPFARYRIILAGCYEGLGAKIEFDRDKLGLEPQFDLFGFLKVNLKTWIWDEGKKLFNIEGKVSWAWDAAREVDLKMLYSGKDKKPFWYFYAADEDVKLGFAKAKNFKLFAGHHAETNPPSVRKNILKLGYNKFPNNLFGKSWKYDEDFGWFAGVSFDSLSAGSGSDLLQIKQTNMIFGDDGIFRGKFDFNPVGINFEPAEIAIDWKNKRFATELSLPAWEFGAYKLDLGTMGVAFEEGGYEFNWGYPKEGNWDDSVTLRWEPPWYPIPVNGMQGGMLIGVGSTKRTFGIGFRFIYERTIGSEGGAFGAYVSGQMGLGGTILSIKKGDLAIGDEKSETFVGTVSFTADAKGGVYILGSRWDILSVGVVAAISYTSEVIDGNNGKYTRNYYSTEVTAGFHICVTPCTCISGRVSFRVEQDNSTGNRPTNNFLRKLYADKTNKIDSANLVMFKSIDEDLPLAAVLLKGMREYNG